MAIRTHAVSMAGRGGQIFALAREQGLTAYDAAYLILALATRSGLATFDRQLAAARDRMGVPQV